MTMNGSAILLDPREPVALQPREGGPTYLLRVPRVADRAAYRREVAAAGGRQWGHLTLIEDVKATVERLLPGEDDRPEREARVAELDAYAQGVRDAFEAWQADRSTENREALTDALRTSARVDEIVGIVRSVDSASARKIADNEVYPQIAGLVAARMFLVGWRDLPAPFRRSAFGLDDALLDQVPTDDLVAIGQRVAELLEPPQDRLGNSASASGGSSTPTPSPEPSAAPESDPSQATGGTATGSAAA